MIPRPLRRLIRGEHRCGKTTTLVEAAAELLGDGFEGQILALSVHRQAVRRLREALYERSGRDIPAADIRRRALAVLERFPTAARLPEGWTAADVISAVDRRLLMRRAWSQAAGEDSLYRQYGGAPGALDWLARVFDAFAEWSGTADPGALAACAPVDPNLQELWAAYHGYLKLSHELGLVAFQEVLPRALDVMRDARVRAAVTPQILLLDDVDLFRPSELLFARAFAGPETSVIATAAALPRRSSGDPRMRYLAAWSQELQLSLSDHASPSPAPNEYSVSFAEYRSPEHEVYAIAQGIAAAVESGDRLDDHAVIVFDGELTPLLRRVLPQWGVPVAGMEARDAYTLALAPLLHAGMALIAGAKMAPEDIVAFLRHPALGLSHADRRHAALAVAGSRGGGDPLVVVSRLRGASLSFEGLARLDRVVAVTEEMRNARALPGAKLRRWIAMLGLEANARSLTELALEPWAAGADETLLAQWLAFVERSEEVRTTLGEPLADLEAVDLLRSAQALVEPIPKPLSEAVQLWQPDQLGGCAAETIWIAGLNEHVLPEPPNLLPFAEAEAFAAAFGSLPGCVPPEPDDRAARWEQARVSLGRALGRAGKRAVLSWSKSDRKGRRRLPSPVLDAREERRLVAPEASGQAQPSRRPIGVSRLIQRGSPGVGAAPETSPIVFTTSPSAIENYLTCPRQYFYARLLRLYDVASSPRQALGQVTHAALRDLEQEGVADPAVMLERHWPAVAGRFGTRLREAAFRHMAEQALANVTTYDRERRQDGLSFVAGEASFHWEIAPGVELRGTIDRIDRGPAGLSVVDYKLGADSPSINRLLAMFAPPVGAVDISTWRPSDLQLPLYALAVEEGEIEGLSLLPGERVAEVVLVFPLQLYGASGKAAAAGRRSVQIVDHGPECTGCGRKSGRSPSAGALCRDQLRLIRERALLAIAEMRAGAIEPDPREGAQTCLRCPFSAICPASQL